MFMKIVNRIPRIPPINGTKPSAIVSAKTIMPTISEIRNTIAPFANARLQNVCFGIPSTLPSMSSRLQRSAKPLMTQLMIGMNLMSARIKSLPNQRFVARMSAQAAPQQPLSNSTVGAGTTFFVFSFFCFFFFFLPASS